MARPHTGIGTGGSAARARGTTLPYSLALLAWVLFLSVPAIAQVDTAWVRRYDAPIHLWDAATALTVDPQGNVYVTGWSCDTDSSRVFLTIKYNADGDTVWTRTYKGPASDDCGHSVVLDNLGNAYVMGVSRGLGTWSDWVTIKYGPDGNVFWTRRYNGPGNQNDYPEAISVDRSGNVYVTGTDGDVTTIKYLPNGDTAWIRRYDGPGKGWDGGSAIVLDDSSNIYVTGGCAESGSPDCDYATVKYKPDGDTVWVRLYDGPAGKHDWANALAVDQARNVYVTGGSEDAGGLSDFATIKYYPNGNTAWVRRYQGPAGGSDWPAEMVIDRAGDIVITGVSQGVAESDDYLTVKYHPNGDTLWTRRYNGPMNDDDRAYCLGLDSIGNVYVSGYSTDSDTYRTYATLKYKPDGATAWLTRYPGPGGGSGVAFDMALDNQSNIHVTGWWCRGSAEMDYMTIKYVQTSSLEEQLLVRSTGLSGPAIRPNPAVSRIVFNAGFSKQGAVRVFDIAGREVPEMRTKIADLHSGRGLDVCRLNSGVYFIIVEEVNRRTIFKITKL